MWSVRGKTYRETGRQQARQTERHTTTQTRRMRIWFNRRSFLCAF